MTATDTTSDATMPTGPIVARAGSYYRNVRYIFTAALILGGAYFLYDGYVTYPEERRLHEAGDPKGKPHSDLDIRVQRAIGYTLPPLGFALIVWTFYRSRGAYLLDGETLHAPGHPAVPVDAIRQIDKSKWERKGIAYLDYDLDSAPVSPTSASTGKRAGRVTLDDFIYDRDPIHAILERVEAHLLPPNTGAAVPETEVAPS
jgi:hypothetical protein